jgi:hypothetical protein
MGFVFRMEKQSRRSKFTYLDLHLPDVRGGEDWKITLDHSTGTGSALRVWDVAQSQAAEKEQRRVEAEVGDPVRAVVEIPGLSDGQIRPENAVVQNRTT